MTHRIFRLVSSLFLALAMIVIASGPLPARAVGPWYVTTTGNDNNDCLSSGTACATINGALAKPGFVLGDTVQVAIGTYTGTGYEVVLLDKDTTLSGGWDSTFTTQSGMSTIDGQSARRGITVNTGATVTVMRFTIQNGFDTYQGAGIFNTGSLTITDSIITANLTSPGYPYGEGGGIWNGWDGINALGGTLNLNNTSVFGNVAYRGGGIVNRQNGSDLDKGGHVTLNFSTIRDNTASASGGIFSSSSYGLFVLTINNSLISGNTATVYNGGGIDFDGKLILNNSTVSGNAANGDGGGIYNGNQLSYYLNNSTVSENSAGGSGGGIQDYYGGALIQNSLIARNAAGISSPDCGGIINSSGYNTIGTTSGCTISASTGDLFGINPLLGPLQNNGGLTFTHALLAGSPAINAGNPTGCTDQDGNLLMTDQRGIARPQGTRCDIGAFELETGGGGGGTEVSIDIKPGSQTNPINPKSTGKIPVAILSTPDFNAVTEIDKTSLTFGSIGDEHSLVSCNKGGTDVNDDGLKDLVCHFKTKLTGFHFGDTEGILRGLTLGGVSIEARDVVRVLHASYP